VRGGVPTPPSLDTPEEGFDRRPERLPGRPLGSTQFDLQSPQSQGSFLVPWVGFAGLVRQSAAFSFLPDPPAASGAGFSPTGHPRTLPSLTPTGKVLAGASRDVTTHG
jgi:hypothetical protein